MSVLQVEVTFREVDTGRKVFDDKYVQWEHAKVSIADYAGKASVVKAVQKLKEGNPFIYRASYLEVTVTPQKAQSYATLAC